MNNGATDFMNILSNSIQTPPSNYYTPASFIYYNVEVLNNDAEFAAFLKSLSYCDNLTSIKISTKRQQKGYGSIIMDFLEKKYLQNMKK